MSSLLNAQFGHSSLVVVLEVILVGIVVQCTSMEIAKPAGRDLGFSLAIILFVLCWITWICLMDGLMKPSLDIFGATIFTSPWFESEQLLF